MHGVAGGSAAWVLCIAYHRVPEQCVGVDTHTAGQHNGSECILNPQSPPDEVVRECGRHIDQMGPKQGHVQ